MPKLLIFFLMILVSFGLHSQEWTKEELDIYHSFDEFQDLLTQQNDTTYVVNFWATWCVPCVKELPYFEALTHKYAGSKIKVILVSLDFENKLETKLIPFLNRNNIRSEVAVLLDPKESSWIDRVDPDWSGAIPVTLVYKRKKRDFYERTFHSVTELEELLKEYINP